MGTAMASEAKRAKQDFSQTFYEELKCQICGSRVKAGKHHWYKCAKYHLVCQDCKEVKGRTSCSCTRYIPDVYCKVIEALLNADKAQFKCENHTRGCQENMEKEDMIFHQSECIYRLVKCPYHKCELEVPFYELLEHMKAPIIRGTICFGKTTTIALRQKCFVSAMAIKKATFGKKVKEFNSLKNAQPLPERVDIENKTFFISFKVQDGAFYHWIHFVGSPHEAKNFSYTLEYFEKESEEIACSQTSKVFSIDETADSIIENGKCFGLPSKYFSAKITFKNISRFDFNYEIRNLKEEAKDDNVESGVSDVDE